MIIAANFDPMFVRLCEAMGQPELATDERYYTHLARGDHAEELDNRIAEWTKTLTAQEIDELLDKHDVVVGPIYTIEDIANDPQFEAREMVRTIEDDYFGAMKVPGFTPQFSDTPADLAWLGPDEPGKHNKEVYGDILGMSDDELAQLKEQGII